MKKQLIALSAIVRAEIRRFMKVWPQSLMPPVITMVLYFVVFGKFIGSQLSDVNGHGYMEFIVPGLIMMSIIMNSYNNTVFSFFVARFHKSIEEILVSPVKHHTLLIGFAIGGVIRGLITGVLVVLASLPFTHFLPHNFFIVLISAILASLFFSLAGFTNAMVARQFDDISIVPTFVLTPLIYLGGVFYSISQLPPIWQTVSYANPIMYIVSTFRYGFLGSGHVNVYSGFAVLGVFVLALYAVNYVLLNKGVGIRT